MKDFPETVDFDTAMRLPPRAVIHRERYDAAAADEAIAGYDAARAQAEAASAPPGARRPGSRWSENAARQLSTPDALRGRMTSVNMMFFMGGPQLGELEAGLVAAAFGVPFAVVTGGVATVVLTALIAWKFPILRRYDTPTPVVAEATA